MPCASRTTWWTPSPSRSVPASPEGWTAPSGCCSTRTSWPPPFPLQFDAVEVLAGYTAFNAPGDRRFDDGVRDFYTLVDHGVLVAPLGNSDTHDLNWVLDGTTRKAPRIVVS